MQQVQHWKLIVTLKTLTHDKTSDLTLRTNVMKENFEKDAEKLLLFVGFQINLNSYSPAIVMYLTHGSAWYPLFSIILR